MISGVIPQDSVLRFIGYIRFQERRIFDEIRGVQLENPT